MSSSQRIAIAAIVLAAAAFGGRTASAKTTKLEFLLSNAPETSFDFDLLH